MSVLSMNSKNFEMWREGTYNGDADKLLCENVDGLCQDLEVMRELIMSTEHILEVMSGKRDAKHWETMLKLRNRSKQKLKI